MYKFTPEEKAASRKLVREICEKYGLTGEGKNAQKYAGKLPSEQTEMPAPVVEKPVEQPEPEKQVIVKSENIIEVPEPVKSAQPKKKVILLEKIKKANGKEKGFTLSDGYNKSWFTALVELEAEGVIEQKKGGFWAK